jgi:hemoglobin/transferrin/lactoferrin receptor protein
LIEGFEVELLRAFAAGFEFFGNYTDITGDNETDDEPLANISPRKGVLGLSYTHTPWYLTVGGRVQIVDDQERVPEGVSRTPGYTVYDLFANWQPLTGALRGLRVNVGIDNITDKEYRRHLAGIPEAGINPKVTILYTKNW